MRSFTLKNTWVQDAQASQNVGWGNGYVTINKEHPLYGKSTEEINEEFPHLVHGGVTLSEKVSSSFFKAFPVIANSLEERDNDQWIIGFGTCHHQDGHRYTTKTAVERELENFFVKVVLMFNTSKKEKELDEMKQMYIYERNKLKKIMDFMQENAKAFGINYGDSITDKIMEILIERKEELQNKNKEI